MMKLFILDCSKQIPEPKKVRCFPNHLNGWVSPTGETYFFEGAKHLLAAKFIGIMLLDINPDDLSKGKFFSEQFDTRLLSLGWLAIINSSWITGAKDAPKFHHKNDLTQAQLDVVWDYCEKHKFEYPYAKSE